MPDAQAATATALQLQDSIRLTSLTPVRYHLVYTPSTHPRCRCHFLSWLYHFETAQPVVLILILILIRSSFHCHHFAAYTELTRHQLGLICPGS